MTFAVKMGTAVILNHEGTSLIVAFVCWQALQHGVRACFVMQVVEPEMKLACCGLVRSDVCGCAGTSSVGMGC